MTKLFLAATAAFLLTGGAALAADLSIPRPVAVAPVVATSAYDWSGFYAGVNGGYAWGNADISSDPVVPFGARSESFSTSGGLVGGTIGYNVNLSDSIVAGVEADLDWANISGTGDALTPRNGAVPNVKTTWLGTARGRIGYAVDNWLLYGTAGLAVGGVSGGATNVATVGDDRSASGTQVGWTAGGGVEVGLTSQLTAKVEYLYTDLGTGNYTLSGSPDFTVHAHPTASIVRAGLNFKF